MGYEAVEMDHQHPGIRCMTFSCICLCMDCVGEKTVVVVFITLTGGEGMILLSYHPSDQPGEAGKEREEETKGKKRKEKKRKEHRQPSARNPHIETKELN